MAIAVSRSLLVLEALAKSNNSLSTIELMEATGIGRASLTRLIESLLNGKFVELVERRRYRIAISSWLIGAAAINKGGIRATAYPHITEFLSKVGGTVNLSFEDGDEIVHVESLTMSTGRLSSTLLYRRLPILYTASGRVVAAYNCYDNEHDLWARQGAEIRTLVASPQELHEYFCRVRADGYAAIDQEHAPDASGLAVPIFEDSGRAVAAVGIPLIGALTTDFAERALPAAVLCARNISAQLGHQASQTTHLA